MPNNQQQEAPVAAKILVLLEGEKEYREHHHVKHQFQVNGAHQVLIVEELNGNKETTVYVGKITLIKITPTRLEVVH